MAKELGDLQKEPPEGIKIHVNEEDLTDIQATVEGPGKNCAKCTVYTGYFYIQLLFCFAVSKMRAITKAHVICCSGNTIRWGFI